MTPRPAAPERESAIRHAFLLANASELYRQVLVVQFEGPHRAGAAGAPDTRLMQAWGAFGMALWSPDALVLDLSGLDYPGGPMIRGVVAPVEPNLEEGFPFFAACSNANRAALEAELPAAAIVDSVDAAIERIRNAGPWAVR